MIIHQWESERCQSQSNWWITQTVSLKWLCWLLALGHMINHWNCPYSWSASQRSIGLPVDNSHKAPHVAKRRHADQGWKCSGMKIEMMKVLMYCNPLLAGVSRQPACHWRLLRIQMEIHEYVVRVVLIRILKYREQLHLTLAKLATRKLTYVPYELGKAVDHWEWLRLSPH